MEQKKSSISRKSMIALRDFQAEKINTMQKCSVCGKFGKLVKHADGQYAVRHQKNNIPPTYKKLKEKHPWRKSYLTTLYCKVIR